MLANRLLQKIMSEIPEVVMNGDPEQRYPGKITHVCLNASVKTWNNFILYFLWSLWVQCVFKSTGCVNLSFAYVEGESLLMALKDVALSSGRSDINFWSANIRFLPFCSLLEMSERLCVCVQRLYVGLSGAVVRPPSDRNRRRPGSLLHQVQTLDRNYVSDNNNINLT